VFAPGTKVAGVFTQSKTASAPVDWCKACLGNGVRSGAGGQQRQRQRLYRPGGFFKGARDVAVAAAKSIGCKSEEVFLASTGVIGEPLPSEKITAVLDRLKGAASGQSLARGHPGDHDTDTYPKMATAHAKIGGVEVLIKRHVQRLGHDHARHGDHAGFRRDGCEAARAVLQEL